MLVEAVNPTIAKLRWSFAHPVATWIVGPYGIFYLREYFGNDGVLDDESGAWAAWALQTSQETAAGAAIFGLWTITAGGCGVDADDCARPQSGDPEAARCGVFGRRRAGAIQVAAEGGFDV